MKKALFILLIAIVAFIQTLQAQSYDPADLVKFKQDTVSHVYVSKIKSNQVYIPLDFNSAEIKDLSAYREIKDYTILKVELVYSTYKKIEVFNQPSLNTERLLELQKEAPELFSNSLTKWKFIAQTDCKNEEEARNLFHGFIITYRPEMMAAYIPSQFESLTYTVEKYVNPDYDKLIRKAAMAKSRCDVANIPIPQALDLRDSVVLMVLKRNKDWKHIPIVCDATGSMYPYIAQTLIWFKLNCNATNAGIYTFFNDGDGKPDSEKVIGKTGGVYTGKETVYDSVQNAMLHTMRMGSGGDSPENNIEALLKTIEKNPDCKELVMIADNLSNVKDIELLHKVTKPVHIILCGSQGGINVEYLNIARSTGGSVHTIESDITNLLEINEGEYFTFRGQKFKLEKGEFKLTYGL